MGFLFPLDRLPRTKKIWGMIRSLFRTGALLLALAAAIIGQILLPQQSWTGAGIVYFALAVVAFLWAIINQPDGSAWRESYEETAVSHPTPPFLLPWRIGLALSTIGLALFAFSHLGNNTFTLNGTLAWLGAVLCFLLLFWEGAASWPGRMKKWWQKRPFSPPFTFTVTRQPSYSAGDIAAGRFLPLLPARQPARRNGQRPGGKAF